jgi:hypothetical protein
MKLTWFLNSSALSLERIVMPREAPAVEQGRIETDGRPTWAADRIREEETVRSIVDLWIRC